MRALAMPGENPDTLKPPEALTADIVRMLSPGFSETGTVFDFPSGKSEALLV
jgi:hypothetical protein